MILLNISYVFSFKSEFYIYLLTLLLYYYYYYTLLLQILHLSSNDSQEWESPKNNRKVET